MKKYKIYLISAQIGDKILYKIGYTKRSVKERVRDFKTGNASNFDILGTYTCKDYHVTLEKRLHKHFTSKQISGEWFDLTDDDIYNFGGLCNRFWEEIHILNTENTYLLERKIKLK